MEIQGAPLRVYHAIVAKLAAGMRQGDRLRLKRMTGPVDA